jgi:hypothetical protein
VPKKSDKEMVIVEEHWTVVEIENRMRVYKVVTEEDRKLFEETCKKVDEVDICLLYDGTDIEYVFKYLSTTPNLKKVSLNVVVRDHLDKLPILLENKNLKELCVSQHGELPTDCLERFQNALLASHISALGLISMDCSCLTKLITLSSNLRSLELSLKSPISFGKDMKTWDKFCLAVNKSTTLNCVHMRIEISETYSSCYEKKLVKAILSNHCITDFSYNDYLPWPTRYFPFNFSLSMRKISLLDFHVNKDFLNMLSQTTSLTHLRLNCYENIEDLYDAAYENGSVIDYDISNVNHARPTMFAFERNKLNRKAAVNACKFILTIKKKVKTNTLLNHLGRDLVFLLASALLKTYPDWKTWNNATDFNYIRIKEDDTKDFVDEENNSFFSASFFDRIYNGIKSLFI